jgi:hypothetical protein
MSILLNRFKNSNINDKLPNSFANVQGQNLLILVQLDGNYSSPANPNYNYSQMDACYTNTTNFAINKYGSLGDATAQIYFYQSPFDIQQIGFNKNTDFLQSTSTTNNIGGMVFGQMSKYQTKSAIGGPNSNIYVSPSNGKFILVVSSMSGSNVYTIYFNPLQNPNLSSLDISSNLSTFCNMVSNADPMCFCTGDICTQSALGGPANATALQTKSPTDYANVKSNCTCLSSQCQYAANNEANTYAQSFKTACKNGTAACGSTFNFFPKQGVYSKDQTWLWNQCGLNSVTSEFTKTTIPTPPAPLPTIDPTPSPPPPSAKPPAKPTSESTKILISIVVIAVIFAIMYYYFM